LPIGPKYTWTKVHHVPECDIGSLFRYQDQLILREGLLVAFFLAGLVVLAGQQQWWPQPVLMGMSSDAMFLGAAILKAFTHNTAVIYLGSLVEGLSVDFKYAFVAGAVTGSSLRYLRRSYPPRGILRGSRSTCPL
jgi:hypothetical protein